MNEIHDRTKLWNADPPELNDKDASWKDFTTSRSALAFGFAATAILIFMFVVMAIFEHVIKPRAASFFPSRNHVQESLELGQSENQIHALEKLKDSQEVGKQFMSPDFSVLMPGQQYPTFIAQPAPLPCPREGINRPSHDACDHFH